MRWVSRICVGLLDLALGLQILASNFVVVDHALRCKPCLAFENHAVAFVDFVLDVYF